MDRGDKGYISYGDFCELSEEKRRNLDPVDTSHVILDPEAKMVREDFVKTYLNNVEIGELEDMSKRVGGGSVVKRTKNTQKLSPKDGNLPQWVRNAPNFRFGVKSDLAKKESPSIGQIINNDYLKDFLQR